MAGNAFERPASGDDGDQIGLDLCGPLNDPDSGAIGRFGLDQAGQPRRRDGGHMKIKKRGVQRPDPALGEKQP